LFSDKFEHITMNMTNGMSSIDCFFIIVPHYDYLKFSNLYVPEAYIVSMALLFFIIGLKGQ